MASKIFNLFIINNIQQPRRIILSGIVAAALAWAVKCAPGGMPKTSPVQESPCTRAFVFVEKGGPAAVIEIPDDAGEPEQRAAEILQSSIQKMSGVTLPVQTASEPGLNGVAAIGFPTRSLPPEIAPQVSSLRRDGFLIATSHRNL
jgi:hypothetical protein